jgi:trehalose 6-phosphate phosphatase
MGAALTEELLNRLDALARAPLLLVASDFDGTLAPIVPEPSMAEASRETVVALRALSQMLQTQVAVISGRALRDLAARTGEIEDLHLIGSHGSEFEAGFAEPLPAEARTLLERMKGFVADVAARTGGSRVEEKPAGLAFHYRNADEHAGAAAVTAILQGPGAWPGAYVRHGKKVIELSVVKTNKGEGLRRLRQRLGAAAVLFLGDDVTDEDAFETLVGPDVGIKVGPGETRARYRAADTVEVARILARVAERRADWLASSYAVPIEQHSLLSDQRTIALLNPTGRAVWLCLPRIDSPAVLGELLGGPAAGFLDVRPLSDAKPLGQQYVGDTFIVETRWPTLSVTDYLDCGGSRALQGAGRTDLLRVLEGKGRVRVTFAPRLDFGRMETRLRVTGEGVEVEGAVEPLVLRAPGLTWRLVEEGRHQTAVAEFTLDDTVQTPFVLELRGGAASVEAEPRPEAVRRERTKRFWSGWAASLTLPPTAPELVRRSALVLKALCYGPTGAMVAAATTSLPEHVGGVRNWDYRYCWPRAAAMSAAALVRVGATDPALKFLDWLLGILDQQAPGALIRPVYSVSGGHLGPEGEISELSGYRGSRPVRIGNRAAQQIQLDVFGPVADLLARLAECGEVLSSEHWRMLEAMVAAVATRWGEPDHGIWEVRRPRQLHLHSQVMCWQTVDRAIRVAHYLGRSRPEWLSLRDAIAADALRRGWSEVRHAFAATQDGHEADAAGLCVGLSGLLPPDEPRWLATLEHVDHELHVGPTVYRYRYDDGLPGAEGGFHLCTSWLIEAYAQVGRRDAAHALFEQLASLAGPTGLLSEEYEPQKRLALGNFPQAYSHLGLINAAVALGK